MSRSFSIFLTASFILACALPAMALLPDLYMQTEFAKIDRDIKNCESSIAKKSTKKKNERKEKKRKDAMTKKLNSLKEKRNKAFEAEEKRLKDSIAQKKSQLKNNPANKIALQRAIKEDEDDLNRLKAFKLGKDYVPGTNYDALAKKMAAEKEKKEPVSVKK